MVKHTGKIADIAKSYSFIFYFHIFFWHGIAHVPELIDEDI